MTRILGINDDKDTCCQCGKAGLEKVVWIEHEDGSVQWYGSSCAARIMYKASTKANRATVLRVARAAQARTDAFSAVSDKNAAASKSVALHECKSRNSRYSGSYRYFELPGSGFYCLPSVCEDHIQALVDRGWREVNKS